MGSGQRGGNVHEEEILVIWVAQDKRLLVNKAAILAALLNPVQVDDVMADGYSAEKFDCPGNLW